MSDSRQQPSTASIAFVESLFREYQRDPEAVAEPWRRYFEAHGDGSARRRQAEAPGPSFKTRSIFNPGRASSVGRPSSDGDDRNVAALQDRVDQFVRAYRVRGHMIAKFDPLESPRPPQPELDPEHYGFTEADLDRQFSSRTIAGGGVRTLRRIIRRLRNTYCRSIGVQFMHIDDLDTRHWLQDRMEGTENRLDLTAHEQVRLYSLLARAVVFEEFVQRKYIGAKSFSLEGCESLIPLLDRAIERAGDHGIDQIVMGMAHRGRLNVLANILQKRPEQIFSEFEDADAKRHLGGGDVKYHLGYSNNWKTLSGRMVHLSLCFNPSHLEFINPVALGRMRAKQDRAGDKRRGKGLVILIHGDASFAGEGIVQETLNMSELDAYTVGGTIHIIVNNQIGFTTSPQEGRSSIYASAVAKMLQIPIFHVNGEDPEAVAQVTRLALDFRHEFRRDVMIDMYGFRRHGHNEGDEPSFTQPVLYRAISKRPSLQESYLERLLKLGRMTRTQAQRIDESVGRELEEGLTVARRREYEPSHASLTGIWSGYQGGLEDRVSDVSTGVERDRLAALLKVQTRVPEGFHRHPKLERGMKARLEMAEGERPLDWSSAESLAMASLATEGIRVRLSGQDSARGTFSQRHAVLYDHENGEPYVPLQHLAADQAPVEIFNSPLSEAGVLGFEYGFSLDYPDSLVLWEAQFGDFVNAAQEIIDQFIVSGEDKWKYLSGIVLLLPHGFEGQGPEHSSARLERFLLLSAEDNIQVVYPTTPAQYFHCLRRQAVRPWRKPLIVLTPKSLLRHKKVVSSLDELASGGFQRVIPDDQEDAGAIKRILLCSGKIYYELLERRESLGRRDVAIVRVEQLYPLPDAALQSALASYADDTPARWVQEEPENMGAWRYWRARFPGKLLGRLPFRGVYGPESASPATGSASSHKLEQDLLLEKAFGDGSGRSY